MRSWIYCGVAADEIDLLPQRAQRQTQVCRSNPLFRNALNDPAVKKALSDSLRLSISLRSSDDPKLHPETAFYYGKSVLGGYSVTPIYTDGNSGSIDPRNAPYRLIRGIYTDAIFFHIHPPPNTPGLSGLKGDVGWSDESDVPVVAVDYDGTPYCYSPR